MILFKTVLMLKYSQLQYSLFIERSCSDSDDMDDDDEICFICDHREVKNGTMGLLVVWTSGKREWSNIKNVKKDFPYIVNKYIKDKGIKVETSKRKRISISKVLKEIEYGKNEQM